MWLYPHSIDWMNHLRVASRAKTEVAAFDLKGGFVPALAGQRHLSLWRSGQ